MSLILIAPVSTDVNLHRVSETPGNQGASVHQRFRVSERKQGKVTLEQLLHELRSSRQHVPTTHRAKLHVNDLFKPGSPPSLPHHELTRCCLLVEGLQPLVA